jgi:hypothetical protein
LILVFRNTIRCNGIGVFIVSINEIAGQITTYLVMLLCRLVI